MGVVGAVALLTIAGCAWLVRYTLQQSAKREDGLLQALKQQGEALERQAQVLRDIHAEIMRHHRPAPAPAPTPAPAAPPPGETG